MRVRERNGLARLTTKRPRQVAGSLPGAEDAARPPSHLVQLERERACELDKREPTQQPANNYHRPPSPRPRPITTTTRDLRCSGRLPSRRELHDSLHQARLCGPGMPRLPGFAVAIHPLEACRPLRPGPLRPRFHPRLDRGCWVLILPDLSTRHHLTEIERLLGTEHGGSLQLTLLSPVIHPTTPNVGPSVRIASLVSSLFITVSFDANLAPSHRHPRPVPLSRSSPVPPTEAMPISHCPHVMPDYW